VAGCRYLKPETRNLKPGNFMAEQQQNINVKIEDVVLKGSYANNMQISFSGEEFTNRVFVSPGHMKRMLTALSGALKKYEEQFGTIKEASAPTNSEIGFKTQ
jgi:hypothetical protein